MKINFNLNVVRHDMPAKSGISHTVAAFVALLISPYIKFVSQSIISGQEVLLAIELASKQLSTHPFLTLDMASMVLYTVVIGIIAFAWGVAYHYNRHV